MYDLNEVLALLTRAHRFHEVMEHRFGEMVQQGGPNSGKSQAVLELVQHQFAAFNLNPMICQTTLDGTITGVNEHFATTAKYTVEELIGKNVNILKNSHMHPGIYTDIWNKLKVGKPWRGQLRNTCADYDSYWIDTAICPVFDADGTVLSYFSLSYNITDQIKIQEELEFKNKQFEDSLRYAKRIQRTILPEPKEMDKALPEYFTIYKPKDIVSGDFYWFVSTVDKVFIAAVDCTGHGVPGAFMSLIGYNQLNSIVIQRRIFNPGLILTELHKGVRSALKQDDKESKSRDGMDISLLCIDRYDNRVQFAGANNPLVWVHDGHLELIKGDKMAIGGEQMEDERNFTNHEIEVGDQDALYLFTDGFVDQFGGPDQKKFGSGRLKTLIQENHHEKMSVQRAMFNIVWKEWMGDDEQIDDVTLIGVRIHL